MSAENLNGTVDESVRIVEVPVVVADEVQYRPVVEVVNVDKTIPVFNYYTREKVVDQMQVETIKTDVDLVQTEDVVKPVVRLKTLNVPTEKIVYKPKIIVKEVEKVLEVQGKMIQRPIEFVQERTVIVPRYITREVPLVVNQLVEPIIFESDSESLEVRLKQYVPQLELVDVFVPKPISRPIILKKSTHFSRVVDVSPAQHNALVRAANTGAKDQTVDGLLVKTRFEKAIPMVNAPDFKVVSPNDDEWTFGHSLGQLLEKIDSNDDSAEEGYVYPELQTTETLVPA